MNRNTIRSTDGPLPSGLEERRPPRVAGVGLHRDVIAAYPFDELERPTAHRVLAEARYTFLFGGRLRHDSEVGATDDRGQEVRLRLLEEDPDRRGVHHHGA